MDTARFEEVPNNQGFYYLHNNVHTALGWPTDTRAFFLRIQLKFGAVLANERPRISNRSCFLLEHFIKHVENSVERSLQIQARYH